VSSDVAEDALHVSLDSVSNCCLICTLQFMQVDATCSQILKSQLDMAAILDASTKFAVCNFVATILTLDFLNKRPYNRAFCEQTLELVCAHVKLKTQVSDGALAYLHTHRPNVLSCHKCSATKNMPAHRKSPI
jgi:hypothetical protein